MRFIRKNGRVIPIRDSVKAAKVPPTRDNMLKPTSKEKAHPAVEAAKGAAFVVAGVGAAYLAGRSRRLGSIMANKTLKKGFKLFSKGAALAAKEKKSPGVQMAFEFAKDSATLAKEAGQQFKRGRQIIGISKAIHNSASIGAIGLTSAGATRIADAAMSGNKNQRQRSQKAAAIGATTGLAVTGTARVVGMYGKQHLGKVAVANLKRFKKFF